MRVLMCITGLNRGGAEKNFTRICVNTAAQGLSFEPVVASLINGYYLSDLGKNNIPVFVLLASKNPVALYRNIVAYAKFLFKNRNTIDVVQAFMPHGGLLGVVSNFVLKKPFVYCVRNSQIHDEFRKSLVRRMVRNAGHLLSLRMATIITCNSPAIKLDLEKRLSKEVVAVLNAVKKPDDAAFIDAKIKSAFFSPAGKYSVVSICNMRYPQKDIITLLRVAKVCPDLRFVLVGGGTGLDFFRQKALEFGSRNVVFTGARRNVFPFLSYGDVYILLTRFEGFPNSVLEAMVAKRPVVMSGIPEVAGLLAHRENCVLVKNGDVEGIAGAIASVKTDAVLRGRIVANAYEMALTKFTLKNMIATNYGVYEKAVKKAGP
ncbi:MAG TPA: glycosyltransferase family 4 protein [Chitinivibrionales bacterium]|nr:glycosyltransferase family 4 protein [Chitinivibrionales bacterium]